MFSCISSKTSDDFDNIKTKIECAACKRMFPENKVYKNEKCCHCLCSDCLKMQPKTSHFQCRNCPTRHLRDDFFKNKKNKDMKEKSKANKKGEKQLKKSFKTNTRDSSGRKTHDESIDSSDGTTVIHIKEQTKSYVDYQEEVYLKDFSKPDLRNTQTNRSSQDNNNYDPPRTLYVNKDLSGYNLKYGKTQEHRSSSSGTSTDLIDTKVQNYKRNIGKQKQQNNQISPIKTEKWADDVWETTNKRARDISRSEIGYGNNTQTHFPETPRVAHGSSHPGNISSKQFIKHESEVTKQEKHLRAVYQKREEHQFQQKDDEFNRIPRGHSAEPQIDYIFKSSTSKKVEKRSGKEILQQPQNKDGKLNWISPDHSVESQIDKMFQSSTSKKVEKNAGSQIDGIVHPSTRKKSGKEEQYQKGPSMIKGLPNIGMTCYANSIFQVLAQTPNFIAYLQKSVKNMRDRANCLVSLTPCLNSFSGLLLSVLMEINNQRDRPHSSSRNVYSLVNKITYSDRSFQLGMQNDSHSFLITLLNAVKSEQFGEKDPISLFEGHMISKFIYNPCSHVDYSEDQVFTSLLIPVDTFKGCSVSDGIEVLLQSEYFEDNILPCRTCIGKHAEFTCKRLEFEKLPDILILQLGKFKQENHQLSKLNKIVRYEHILHMPFNDQNSTKMDYELYGVTLHSGSLSGGHYTAYVKRDNGNNNSEWYECSDSYVRRISNKDSVLDDRQAFLLFYHSTNLQFIETRL